MTLKDLRYALSDVCKLSKDCKLDALDTADEILGHLIAWGIVTVDEKQDVVVDEIKVTMH